MKQAVSTATSPGRYYDWSAPGQPFSVQIDLRVVGEIEAAVKAQSRAAPGRSPEIGGVLFGCVAADGSVVSIEGQVPVECEHRRGLSYVLSSADRRCLERTLRKGSLERRVVGFYRSHTRVGLYLDEDDYSLIQNYFANPSYVFLLVRPSTQGAPVAGFFFWEEDGLRRHATYAEFPFGAAELDGRSRAIEPPAVSSQSPAQKEAESPVLAPPPPQATGRPMWTRTRVAVLAALSAVALIGAGAGVPKFFEPRPSVGISADFPPGMWVTRQGPYLHVGWRGDAPSVLQASGGVLTITEGAHRRQLKLDRQQLTTASVAYHPLGRDVSFRLDLVARNAVVSETLRFEELPCRAAAPRAPKVSRPSARHAAPVRWYDDGL